MAVGVKRQSMVVLLSLESRDMEGEDENEVKVQNHCQDETSVKDKLVSFRSRACQRGSFSSNFYLTSSTKH